LQRDFGIEIAQALHVIEQIAPAFVQQVIVESVFFIDRDILSQLGASYLEALDRDHNLRSRLDVKGIIHGICFRTISPTGDCDL